MYHKLVDKNLLKNEEEASEPTAQKKVTRRMQRDFSSKMIRNLSKGCLSFDHSELEEDFRNLGTQRRLEQMQFPEGLTIVDEARFPNKWDKLSTSQLGSMMEEFNLLNRDTKSVNRLLKSHGQGFPDLKPSDSGNLRKNEMEIIYENRKNMGIRKPEFGEQGMSEMGSIIEWGSPPTVRQKFQNRPKPHHVRTKSSNMLEEGKKHPLLTHQFTLESDFPQKNSKLERMKRCESGLDSQRKKTNWSKLLDFKSPDIRQTRDYFNPNSVAKMMNKTGTLKLEMSPDSPSPLVSHATPFESQVRS